MSQRVFVTGIGVVSPIGVNTREFWKNLSQGKSNFQKIPAVYPGMEDGYVAALIDSEDKKKIKNDIEGLLGYVPPDSSLYAITALYEALKQAQLQPREELLRKALIAVGNSEGQTDLIDQKIESQVDLWKRYVYASHSITDLIAHTTGSFGPCFTTHNTCASANASIEFAEQALRVGLADIAIVGGTDSFSYKVWSGFYTLSAVGDVACAPFSKERKFISISEGAAILILQSERSIKKNQTLLAEILGAASCNDAQHPTNPDINGVKRCHQLVLKNAGLQPSDIDLIFAHGTGTRANDVVEAEVFQTLMPQARITAIKGTVGHLMATAGAVGAVASVLSLQHQLVPPTLIKKSDLEYPINLVVIDDPIPRPTLRRVQNNSFGFGGNNAITIFGSVDRK